MNNINNTSIITLYTRSILSSFIGKRVYKEYWDKVYGLDYDNHIVNNNSIFVSFRSFDSKK